LFHQVEARQLRLFFGLPLPGALREHLDRWHRTHVGLEGWSKAEGLHLTLAFLGQRPVASLPGLEALAASVAARHGPLDLRTAALGSFTRLDTTRLLWLGLVPAPALAALAGDLGRTLQAAGEAMDTRPFHPHVTLARFRQAQPLARFTAPPPVAFPAEVLTLFESGPHGCYSGVRSWSLQRV
jgi:2'-5' RNA ligase